MSGYSWLLWLHIVAACTWAGGIVVLAFLLPALVRSGASEEVVRAGVRVFARLSWTALAILAITGLGQMHALHLGLHYRPLVIKLGLVVALVVVTALHQFLVRRSSAPVRRLLELGILLLTLAVLRQAIEI